MKLLSGVLTLTLSVPLLTSCTAVEPSPITSETSTISASQKGEYAEPEYNDVAVSTDIKKIATMLETSIAGLPGGVYPLTTSMLQKGSGQGNVESGVKLSAGTVVTVTGNTNHYFIKGVNPHGIKAAKGLHYDSYKRDITSSDENHESEQGQHQSVLTVSNGSVTQTTP